MKKVPIFFLISLVILSQIAYQNSNYSQNISSNSKDWEGQRGPRTSAERYYNNIQWFENKDFSSPSIYPWLNTTQGDSTDVLASNSSGQADYIILGGVYTKEISNVFDDTSKWTPFNKSDNDPNPDNYDVDSNGVWCDKIFNEGVSQADQFPKMYWRYNVSMGKDMSDYEITSASIEASMNASVNRDVDVLGDTIARYDNNRIIEDFSKMDSIFFSVDISDMDVSQENTVLIADNTTTELGRYDNVEPGYLNVSSIDLTPKLLEEDLTFHIERLLGIDPGHDNFTIILGIAIDCADNCAGGLGDKDEFSECRIKSLNLTFTYKKKIDLDTTLSWYQEGNKLDYASVKVTEAKFNFEYKIDKNWSITTGDSSYSKFKILINNKEQSSYPDILLSKANETFQKAREDGYNLANLIPIDTNITLSIQVSLEKDFILDQPINISIDNINFDISYIVFLPDPPRGLIREEDGNGAKVEEAPWIALIIAIIVIAGAICLGGYLVAYQLYLKYPKPVRKVRKYRKTLKKKKSPKIDTLNRENAYKNIFKSKSADILSNLKGRPKSQIIDTDKIIKKTTKPINKKQTAK